MTIDVSQDQQEQRAERNAYHLLHHATSFTGCLLQQGLAVSQETITAKGDRITLFGKQIYDGRTWKKFLAARTTELSFISLSEQIHPLTEEYVAWLLATTRFQTLTSEEHLAWLKHVATLSVTWRLLEHKSDAAMIGEGPPFADPLIQVLMGLHLLRQTLIQECARLIHHAVKHQSEQDVSLLEAQLREVLSKAAQLPLPTNFLPEPENHHQIDMIEQKGLFDE